MPSRCRHRRSRIESAGWKTYGTTDSRHGLEDYQHECLYVEVRSVHELSNLAFAGKFVTGKKSFIFLYFTLYSNTETKKIDIIEVKF